MPIQTSSMLARASAFVPFWILGYIGLHEVEVNLRPTISRPVCLVVGCPSGICDQLFFLVEITFRQLRVYYFVAPSQKRGRACNLLLGLASAVTFGALTKVSNHSRNRLFNISYVLTATAICWVSNALCTCQQTAAINNLCTFIPCTKRMV
jgi:hypothetical protein